MNSTNYENSSEVFFFQCIHISVVEYKRIFYERRKWRERCWKTFVFESIVVMLKQQYRQQTPNVALRPPLFRFETKTRQAGRQTVNCYHFPGHIKFWEKNGNETELLVNVSLSYKKKAKDSCALCCCCCCWLFKVQVISRKIREEKKERTKKKQKKTETWNKKQHNLCATSIKELKEK